jgi:hypothetical protein
MLYYLQLLFLLFFLLVEMTQALQALEVQAEQGVLCPQLEVRELTQAAKAAHD